MTFWAVRAGMVPILWWIVYNPGMTKLQTVTRRRRPPNPWSPLVVELEPQLKMDLAAAAHDLNVKLADLIGPLLAKLRGQPGQTEDLIRAWRRSTK